MNKTFPASHIYRWTSAGCVLGIVVLAFIPLAEATATLKHRFIPDIQSTVTVGPGTVISVSRLDLPFVGEAYDIEYKPDNGDKIELWHQGSLIIVQGMHGMLTYSHTPEHVINFRVLGSATAREHSTD